VHPDPYAWELHAETVVLVPVLAAAYVVVAPRNRLQPWRVGCFAAGLLLVLLAFLTPLEPLSLHYLLTAHLLQNVVLAEWAPALCVLGLAPELARRVERFRAARTLTHPLVSLPLWLGTYFVWHVPAVYDAALHRPGTLLHVEHGCYFATGVVLWWPVATGRLEPGIAAAYLFAAFVLASPLGLLLALLPRAAYPFYEHAPRLWGLTPLEDQQIAGLTMAAEQAVVFFAACTYVFVRFLAGEERVAFQR
jgi:cytochrome c oxidase assembly factor CtaG